MVRMINIVDELRKEQQHSLLNEVSSILSSEQKKEEAILFRIQNPDSISENLKMFSEHVFTKEVIRNIAIRYRLRFLEAKLFKGEIPYEAVLKIKELEKKHKVKFTEFRILAPASLFKLEDRNKDPLLFAKTAENKFLLIHKWGNDLNAFRKILAFPLRTIRTFIYTMISFSLLITLSSPVEYPVLLFIFLLSNLFFISVFTRTGYLRLNQNFSEFEWDSRFIN